MSAVGRTFGGAADKISQTGDKVGEYRDYTAEKAKETNDSVAQKKLCEYKDAAVESKDAVAQNTSETLDATRNKVGEYKDAAAEKGRKAGEYADDATRGSARTAADKARNTAGTHGVDRYCVPLQLLHRHDAPFNL
jgi:hypothetical protein